MQSTNDEPRSTNRDDQITQGLDLLQQGLSIFDADMRLVSCNRRFVSMYELPPELAAPGATFEAINRYLANKGEYGPGDPEALVAARVELARRFEPHHIERTRPDGKRFLIEGHPLRQGGWVTIYSDITESWNQEQVLKARSDELSDKLLLYTEEQARTNRQLAATNRALEQTQINLKISEARTRTITNAMPAHIAYVDRDYIYRFSNNRIHDVMGIQPARVLGQHMSDVVPPDSYALLRAKLDESFAGKTVTVDYTVQRRTEGEQSIRTTFSPEFDQQGAVIGAFVLSINVSTEKAAIQMQLHAKRMETTAQLTSGLAHDFANILTVILGNLHRLGRDATTRQHELLNSTERAAKRGTRIIDNLMALLYRHQLDTREANVSTMLRDLVPLFSSLSSTIRLDLNLPDTDIIAIVDEGALQDVILNILFNSKDAIETTSADGVITLDAQLISEPVSQTSAVCITVTDTGHGFSSEALGSATEPFFSTKPQGKGSGLGLSMVHSIIEQSGGQLRLSNAPNGGAVVNLSIPRDRVAPAAMDSSDLHSTIAKPDNSQTLALIVDDDTEIRALVREYLSDLGWLSVEASHADEAFNLIEQLEDINVVISDVIMPGEHNGLDLALHLRKHRHDIDLLLISGLPRNAPLLQRAREQFSVLHKPFSKEVLIANLIGLRSKRA